MFVQINSATAERLEARRAGERGFTLIELLVVVIIIGVLAAIAIPVFLNQREAAWRSSVESDLRNAAIAVQTEATSQNGSYAWLTSVSDLEDAGYVASDGVEITIVSATSTSYQLSGTHTELSESITFDSATGGLGVWVAD